MASPLLLGRLYSHQVSEASGRRAKRRSPADRQFCDERIRDGFSGLLWTAGAVFTRCCSPVATAYAWNCQAESAGETPLPPTARLTPSHSGGVGPPARCVRGAAACRGAARRTAG